MNKKTQQTLFSSAKQDWATPWDVFEWACRGYRPTQDVCATAENTKCGASYYDRNMDGLRQDWTGVCWMNPPYGREIGRWVKKAHDSAQEGATVICLLPARTDTKWWHSYVEPIRRGDFPGEIRFYKGRVKFIGAKASAPFPSVVVIFGPDYHHFSTATVNLSI